MSSPQKQDILSTREICVDYAALMSRVLFADKISLHQENARECGVAIQEHFFQVQSLLCVHIQICIYICLLNALYSAYVLGFSVLFFKRPCLHIFPSLPMFSLSIVSSLKNLHRKGPLLYLVVERTLLG